MSKTPKLRFKEFSGDWESNKLKELCSDFIVPMRDKPQVFDGNIPWCRIEDIEGKYLNGTKSNQYVSKETVDNMNLKVNPTGTLICSCSAAIGNNAITTTPLITNQTFIGLVCEKVNNEYLYYLMGTQKRNLEKIAGGTTIPYISRKKFEEFNVIVPTIKEQEKIASFFSLIDDKISLQGEKLEMLKDYKRGMMQKIFSRELRFKDDEGRDYPEWKHIELKEMIVLTIDNRGKTPPIVKNGIPLLEVNSLGSMYPDFKKINKFVDEETYNEWFRNHIQEGDLLFTTVGATGLVSLANSTKSCIAQNIVGFRFKEGYTSEFMYNLFNYRETMKRIKAIEMGAVQPSVKVTQLIKLKFSIPSIDEQIKIGKILSSIDLKIQKEQEKLDSLNEYKKGLLQQMFV